MSANSPREISELLAESGPDRMADGKLSKLASVRVSPGAYFATAAVTTFVSLLLLRAENDLGALITIVCTWTIVPLLVLTDRIHFDGRALSRRGAVAWLSRLIFGRTQRIALDEIERVEVHALRTLRRGGSVRYRYRIEITGNRVVLVFASAGSSFRKMVRSLLPRIAEAKLDARAVELRDHLVDPAAVRAEIKQLGIAPTVVLEAGDLAARGRQRLANRGKRDTTAEDLDRARRLRDAANDLRVAGRLRESAEAFRRALMVTPQEPKLIYEFARLLRSRAGATEDSRLFLRASAALRLAARRGKGDARLLERIGESLLEYGKSEQAGKAFRQALEADPNAFRAQAGLAEAALSDGKLAHVIHHYSEASRSAPDRAAAKLSRREADYYLRLSNDDEYLAVELRRMNWLQHAGRIQQFAARVSFASLLVALICGSINQVVAGLGWALASSSIIAWSSSLIASKLLSSRRKQPAQT